MKATVTVELALNSRTAHGCQHAEDNGYLSTYGYAALDTKRLVATLDQLDFGRYDSEGDSYLEEVLQVLPADIVNTVLEEVL